MQLEARRVNLTASARLIQQLGEQLISDELVALMELIKNGYDADATSVDIYINTEENTEYGKGKIVIEDNGNGMIPSIIIGAFLRLSSNYKEEERLSLHFKRRVLGKKGIGRLSFQRLGRYIKVFTTPRLDRYIDHLTEEDKEIIAKHNTYRIDIDWYNFSLDIDLQDIEAQVQYEFDNSPIYGTRIEILGIRNHSFWDMNQNKINRLRREVFGMVNPFMKLTDEIFFINVNVNGKDYSNDKIEEEVLEKSCDIKVDFSFNDWIFNIEVRRKNKYYIREKNKKISRMQDNGFESSKINEHIEEISTYVLDLNDFDKLMQDYPFLKKFKFDTVKDKDNNFIKAYPGDFIGTLYASDFSTESNNYVRSLVESKVFINNKIRLFDEISRIWDSAKGLYLFRNKFRILPYGNKDWVGFTDKSQTYRNNIYKENTVAGYITIDGETSEFLEEQTNRMGLVEDEFGKNFFALIQLVLLEVLVREDVNFREGFSDDKKTINDEIVKTNNKLLEFKKIITKESEKALALSSIETALNDSLDGKNKDTTNNNNEQPNNTKTENELLINLLRQYFSDEGEIVKIINSQDNSIKAMLEIIIKTMNEGGLLKSNIKNLIDKLNELKHIDNEITSKNKQELYFKKAEIEEIKEILPLVGQGIIVESLTHELNRIDENIRTYASKTIDGLSAGIDINLLIDYQDNIIDETVFLSEQLQHIEPTYRRNYGVNEVISIKNFLTDMYIKNGPMVKKAKKSGINVVIEGDDFSLTANKGFMITVFDNLFLNSMYWIDTMNNSDKFIRFKIDSSGVVEYSDSGPGIHPKIENKLFMPFESMKVNGRGLGLYIVQELLGMIGGNIYLSNERRSGRLHKFILKFSYVLGV